MDNLNFDETKQSQLPFVEMLINMGYRYVSVAEAMVERRGDIGKFILRDTAARKFMEINSYEHEGKSYKFGEKEIEDVIDELETVPFEGLIDTSKNIFGMIMPKTGGKTIKVFHGGSNVSKSFRYIDFENPLNNDFAVTVEFVAAGRQDIRVDIVIFVNGIPFCLIENKKSAEDIKVAIAQQLRNQSSAYSPRLFIYPQLLIAANKEGLKYGTTGTPEKFYMKWNEREIADREWERRETFAKEYEKEVSTVIAKKIDENIYGQILSDLNGATYGHTQVTERLTTAQDLGVYSLLRKERLLDITKNFVLYDAGIKKVMRYQQYFAIKKMLIRIKETEMHKPGEKRRGGILWQTQGSGKSLTMVMFVRALIEDSEIKNPRIIIVTDRKDLDRQIKGTFANAGLKKEVKQAKSGAHLLKLIQQKDLRVVTTLVHKFQTASNKTGLVDPDKNIFVLIDEAHRTQHGAANLEMNRTIPNACYIAFTGTPLLKKEKSQQKFGSFIDRYTIEDALDDEIVLPLIYEGRYVDLRQDQKEVDKQTGRWELNEPQKKYMESRVVPKLLQDNPQRIKEIAYDIEKHYCKKFQGTGLKAQVVAPSKYAATLFQKYFLESGKITTALVISDENGIIPEGDGHKKEVDEYLKGIKANYQSLLSYEKEVIDSFKYNDEGIEILIVVDKLLTGFDAPRNTVLYLAKELRDHNLLQAIARVNRLFDNDALPKTAGYIVDYSENAQNLKTAMDLFGKYDTEDVRGVLVDVDEKIEEIEIAYSTLHDIFRGVAKDDEAYLQFLTDEGTRKNFYESLNAFLKTFSECMNLRDFVHEFKNLDTYQNEIKKFMNLRKTVSLRFADHVDFSRYEIALIKILDENIKAEEAELLTRQISINDKDVFEEALKDIGSDKSKAEAIAAQMQRTIIELMDRDPEFYGSFSKKIAKLLEDMRAKKLADIEALRQARMIQEQMEKREDGELPVLIRETEGADVMYRNLKVDMEVYHISEDEFEKLILELVEVIREKSIVDWQQSREQKRIMLNAIDDYFYDVVKIRMGIEINNEDRQKIISKVMDLAVNNHDVL